MPNQPGENPYTGDAYPREGCIVSIDVTKYGYGLRIAAPNGAPMEVYAYAKTPRAIGRMVEEWCAGFVRRIRGRFDQPPESSESKS